MAEDIQEILHNCFCSAVEYLLLAKNARDLCGCWYSTSKPPEEI